jgi:hypothetical protein
LSKSVEPFIHRGLSGFQCGLPGNKFSHPFPLVGLSTQEKIDVVALATGGFDQVGNADIDAPELIGIKIQLVGL